jgi:hypothetical protein
MLNILMPTWYVVSRKLERLATGLQRRYLFLVRILCVVLGGLVVSVLAMDPRFAGSIPAEVDGFLRVIKIRSTTSFGGDVVDLRHVKEPYGYE